MSEGDPGRFDHSAIDEVIHGRLRLGVMAYLSSVDAALFGEVRDAVGATDGNLSGQLRKLEAADYVRVTKTFVGRKPQTHLALTSTGRSAWKTWLDRIEQMTR